MQRLPIARNKEEKQGLLIAAVLKEKLWFTVTRSANKPNRFRY